MTKEKFLANQITELSGGYKGLNEGFMISMCEICSDLWKEVGILVPGFSLDLLDMGDLSSPHTGRTSAGRQSVNGRDS